MGLSELLPVQQIATFYAGWYGAELSGVKLADGDPETQLDELCWVNVARRAHPDDDAAAERLLEEGRALLSTSYALTPTPSLGLQPG